MTWVTLLLLFGKGPNPIGELYSWKLVGN